MLANPSTHNHLTVFKIDLLENLTLLEEKVRIQDEIEELNELTNSNDELELEINAGIDYEQIYNTAVNELGMVYPERDQVITYDAGVSEYVKQYHDIP